MVKRSREGLPFTRGLAYAILRAARRAGRECLPRREDRCRFGLAQVAACLVLRHYLRLDLRALERLVASDPRVRAISGLKESPDYSTFARAWGRVPEPQRRLLLERTLDLLTREASEGREWPRVSGRAPVIHLPSTAKTQRCYQSALALPAF